ncbi:AAA family ATPase [Haloarchaeobius amylolyticus]|uniref:AAA family ATPase n=1 Tax=Haloarchaeobius amylolyticus TaxID=1198296 RepID=UPI00227214AA|nr:AAA family ATPase [Haloarchaeobius amylolyticus]
MLAVVCGLPGAGKTTVAEDVADRTGGTLLRTDVVRKDLLEDPDYTEVESYMVYEGLFERAKALLDEGETVVLDGTFQRRGDRVRAKAIARLVGARFELVRVVCDEAVVRERIAAREGDESDADFEVHQHFREVFDEVTMDHARVDNSGSLAATEDQVDAVFAARFTPAVEP